ncbi:MAG: LysR family transcriptional regulator [bacterium]
MAKITKAPPAPHRPIGKLRPTLRPNCRLWMYAPGIAGVFGDGKCRLLHGIATHGSLQKAAQETGISYRKAWADLRKAEACIGIPLVSRQRGGRAGGTTTLTAEAQQILAAYARFRKEMIAGLEVSFARFIQQVRTAVQ